MRIVFMGTPAFAATILGDLVQAHEVAAVYTRPDAIRARGNRFEPSPVRQVAERLGIAVRTPHSIRDEVVQRELATFKPDVICVAAYGAIIPAAVLRIPHFGCLNVHASLLPRWRGAAPIERAILAGDKETGVCVMRMEEGLDTGAYCVCRAIEIGDKGTDELTDELAGLGARALLTALARVEDGVVDWIDQDDAQSTYAPKVEKRELNLSPADESDMLVRKVQASSDAHPARAVVAGRVVTVLCLASADKECVRELAANMVPGEVRFAGKRLFLGANKGAVEVVSLKPDGKKVMDAKAFAAGIQGIRDGGCTWDDSDV